MVGVVVSCLLPSFALAEDTTSTPVSSTDTTASSTPVSTVTPPSSDTSTASSTPVSTPTPSKPKPSSKSATVIKDGSSTKPRTVVSTPVSTSAPNAVSNLTITNVSPKSIDLAWNVPQSQVVVTGFDIRMSTKPIDNSNFDSSIQVGGVSGGVTGAKITATASDLPPKTKIYFALKTIDQNNNLSNISNVVSATTGTVVNSNANSVVDQSSQFTPAQDISKQQTANTDDSQNNNTPAQVKLVILMPDQTPPTTPIFVNFVNTATGVSYGGPATGGIASYVVPPGNYTVKIITTDPLLTVPDLAGFTITSGEIKQLDSVVLGQLASDPELDSLNQNQSIGFGYIIKLLGKIILMLEQILAKLNSK